MTQIRALVWKDLQVHWRAAGLLLAGWPIGVRLLVSVVPPSQDAGGPPLPMVVAMVSLFLFLAITAGLATTLVERERTKETFAWLRTLPVSDTHIVLAKCATGFVLHACGWVAWWAVLWDVAPAVTLPQAASLWWLTLVVGLVPLACQLAIPGRLALASPVVLLGLALLAAVPLQRSPAVWLSVIDLWRGSWGHLLLSACCVAAYALIAAAACLCFHAADTRVLVE